MTVFKNTYIHYNVHAETDRIKQKAKYAFYQRPTIDWNIKCEEKGHTRQNAYDILNMYPVIGWDFERHGNFITFALVIAAIYVFLVFVQCC